jgi:energy-coupling factor transporter ATP-binding protein EcfA2
MTQQTEYTHDLFVSYANADRAWVEGYLLDGLTQAGVRCHSEAAFALGMPRLLEFERAVKESARSLLVLSPAYLVEGSTQFTDLLAQSYGLETATWPVIPLILQRVELPPRLAMLTALDATDPDAWPQVLERLLSDLQRPVPGPAARPPCPYPGMVPFRADDASFFYGRDGEIRHMLQRLRHQRALFVIGPSGCGKSSLIFAGLLPQLAQSSYFSQGFWLVRDFRPGTQPLQALSEVIGGDAAQPAQAVSDLMIAQSPAQRLLLVIDQFEEFFTQAERAEQTRFIAVLQDLRAVESCALLIAMRADFYPDLMNSDLWPVDLSQRLEIAPLRGEALRQAIQQPAEDVGVYLEAGLLERLLADAADEPGVLPLVQETMVLLWGEMQRRLLPLSAYERLGGEGRSGLAVAIATKADATLAEIAPAHQAIARRIFLRLVQFGEGRPDMRRSV